MSVEEKDEILSRISAAIGLIKWLGGGAVSAFIALIVLIVADHYDQANIRKDTDWMKPRVERMWYKTHPEDLAGDPSQRPLP
jgi:hypothetical protein